MVADVVEDVDGLSGRVGPSAHSFINLKCSVNTRFIILLDTLSFELFRNRTLMILPLDQEMSLSSQRPACLNSGDVLS